MSDWLVGGGETGDLIRSMDWSVTALGVRSAWPQSLRTAVAIVVSSHFPMAVLWGTELALLYNDACARLIAGRHPGAMGRPVETVWPEPSGLSRPLLEQVITQGQTVYVEDKSLRLAVHDRVEDARFAVCYSPIRIEDGTVGGALVTMIETTQRIRTERQLQEANDTLERRVMDRTAALAQDEQHYRLLYETMLQGVVYHDREGRIISMNPAAERILGRTPAEFLGHTSADEEQHTIREDGSLFPAAEHPAMVALRTGQKVPATVMGVYNPREKAYRWISVTAVPMFKDEDDRPYQGYAIFDDITDRRQAQEILRQRESLLRALSEGTPDPLFIKDRDGRLLLANPATVSAIGKPADQILGHTDVEFYDDPAVGRAMMDNDRRVMESGQTEAIEETVPTPQGPRVFLSTKTPWRDAQGRIIGLIGSARDITERKAMEKALAAAKNEAEYAGQAKDHFLAVLSHELRTPLTPVVATLAMLQDDPQFDAQTRERLEMIRRNVELEARLIDDLLDLTRIARGKIELFLETLALPAVLQRAIEVCMPDIETRQVRFRADVEPGLLYVRADASRLQQVFWNLLSNAVKFTPMGGRINVRCFSQSGGVVVEIADNGAGIEGEALARIFDAFEQADRAVTRKFGGLGLGLAICRALVTLHGGVITAHSPGRGQGATFRVVLPIVQGPPTQHPPAPGYVAIRKAQRQPLRILLVEDHGDTARVMRQILQNKGHEVQAAGDVASALKAAEREAFDLVISDLGLPDGDGLDLMRQLKQRHGLRGIALSGFGMEEDIRRSQEAGFLAHLTKPITPQQLDEVIESLSPQ